MLKVLVVEDDLMIADALEEILVDAGYEVCGIASTVDEAVRLGKSQRPDLGVIDFRLAGGGYGTEVTAELRKLGQFGVLYATGNPDHPMLIRSKGDGCIAKPYSSRSIISALRKVWQKMDDRTTTAK
ncbi:response regulator [Lichenicola sp.]|uniref:response regulator n=1 Tax=Lichenicola sp. TaxID=2804529 RepID=UPI003B00ED2D